MKKLVSMICIVVVFATAKGQYVTDALKYSQNFPAITARSLGMGGAFTSLGGDFSSLEFNPAGLGLYRKSELVFTPSLNVSGTEASYKGQKHEDNYNQFFVGSGGYVGIYNTHMDKGLVNFTYAMGYTRQNNYNNNIYMQGSNAENSLSDFFMENASGVDPEDLDPFYERLAFDSYIIDTIPGTLDYSTPVFLPTDQRKVIETRGGTGKWTAGFGLNFSNVFYIGMGLGWEQLQLSRMALHSEFDSDPDHDFSMFQFREDLKVDGSGFHMNFGMMARLFKIMRVGATFHLPTYYHIHERYYNTIYSEFKNGDNYPVVPTDPNGDELAEGDYKYRLNTPLKVQGGLSVQIGTMGIISGDVEFVNYGNMSLKDDDYYTDFDGSNNQIDAVYKSVVNLKLGGEVRFNHVSLRLGGGFYPSPCESIPAPDIFNYISNVPSDYFEYTAGIGYRTNFFFFDLGFSGLTHDEKYNLYWDNPSNLSQNQYRFLATLGFRF